MPKRSRTPSMPSCYNDESGSGGSGDGDGPRKNDNDVPFVEHHDGRRFWSNRFYLNSIPEDSSSSSLSYSYSKQHKICSCGSLEPPPTFPLADFVNQSLDIKASVMATFSLHPEWFRETFPRFGFAPAPRRDSDKDDSKTTIPTFIFHGHRGLENALAERGNQTEKVEYETDREEDDENENTGSCKYGYSQDGIDGNSLSSKFQYFLPTTAKATETARCFVNNPHLQLCQVHCNWEKNQRALLPRRVSTGKENTPAINGPVRETKFGVHHPKFHLLFEQSGDLVVIVTTTNLTPTNSSTVEGSWVQRFRRRTKRQPSPHYHQHHGQNDFGPVLQDFLVRMSEAAAAGPSRNGQAQVPLANNKDNTKNCKRNSSRLPLEEFLRKHIGLKSLSEFSSFYHFETAGAFLVPVIPGDYEYNPAESSLGSDRHKRPRNFYGRQRVRYILETLAISTPKISKKTRDKSKSDRLLLQPTSLGSDWSRSQFASLIREYMGYFSCNNSASAPSRERNSPQEKGKISRKKQKNNHDYSHHRDDFWVCNQADIVWPSDQFMIGEFKLMQSVGSDSAEVLSPLQAATRKGEDNTVMSSNIFNSSRTFNACDFEFVARMTKYQPGTPCQLRGSNHIHPTSKTKICKLPHFKSIARLFPNHVAMHKRNVPPADAYLSWFLMTSACLSLGAQGSVIDKVSNSIERDEKEKNGHDESLPSTVSSCTSTVSYRNFELGVLFASHLPKKEKRAPKTKGLSTTESRSEKEKQGRKSIVYCFRPHRCSCGHGGNVAPNSSHPDLVHLPVPYSLKPEPYFSKEGDDEDDNDDVTMNENPYFHEILDGSKCIGNMLLTPFGQRESNQSSAL